MARAILLHPIVLAALAELPAKEGRRIKDALANLAEDPYRSRPRVDIKRLKGTRAREDLFRLRIGEWRAIYAVTKKEILVTDLFRRGEGYEV